MVLIKKSFMGPENKKFPLPLPFDTEACVGMHNSSHYQTRHGVIQSAEGAK